MVVNFVQLHSRAEQTPKVQLVQQQFFSMFRLFFVRFDNQHHSSVSSSFQSDFPSIMFQFLRSGIFILYTTSTCFQKKEQVRRQAALAPFGNLSCIFLLGGRGVKTDLA